MSLSSGLRELVQRIEQLENELHRAVARANSLKQQYRESLRMRNGWKEKYRRLLASFPHVSLSRGMERGAFQAERNTEMTSLTLGPAALGAVSRKRRHEVDIGNHKKRVRADSRTEVIVLDGEDEPDQCAEVETREEVPIAVTSNKQTAVMTVASPPSIGPTYKGPPRCPRSKDDVSDSALAFTSPHGDVPLPRMASPILRGNLDENTLSLFLELARRMPKVSSEGLMFCLKKVLPPLPIRENYQMEARELLHLYRNFADEYLVEGTRNGAFVNMSRRELDILVFCISKGFSYQDCSVLMPYRSDSSIKRMLISVKKLCCDQWKDPLWEEYTERVNSTVSLLFELEQVPVTGASQASERHSVDVTVGTSFVPEKVTSHTMITYQDNKHELLQTNKGPTKHYQRNLDMDQQEESKKYPRSGSRISRVGDAASDDCSTVLTASKDNESGTIETTNTSLMSKGACRLKPEGGTMVQRKDDSTGAINGPNELSKEPEDDSISKGDPEDVAQMGLLPGGEEEKNSGLPHHSNEDWTSESGKEAKGERGLHKLAQLMSVLAEQPGTTQPHLDTSQDVPSKPKNDTDEEKATGIPVQATASSEGACPSQSDVSDRSKQGSTKLDKEVSSENGQDSLLSEGSSTTTMDSSVSGHSSERL